MVLMTSVVSLAKVTLKEKLLPRKSWLGKPSDTLAVGIPIGRAWGDGKPVRSRPAVLAIVAGCRVSGRGAEKFLTKGGMGVQSAGWGARAEAVGASPKKIATPNANNALNPRTW